MVASYLLPPLPSRPPKVVGIPRNQVKRYTYLRQYHSAPPIVPTPRKEKKKKRKPTFGYGLLPPVVVDSRLLEFSRTQTRLFLVRYLFTTIFLQILVDNVGSFA